MGMVLTHHLNGRVKKIIGTWGTMATIMAEIPSGHLLNISDIISTNMLSNNIYNRDCICLSVPVSLQLLKLSSLMTIEMA